MNKVLKNPIHPKQKMVGKYPFGFDAPSYDNRTSCSMNAGNDYGIGFRNPVGKETAFGPESGPIPQKAHMFKPEEIFKNEDMAG